MRGRRERVRERLRPAFALLAVGGLAAVATVGVGAIGGDAAGGGPDCAQAAIGLPGAGAQSSDDVEPRLDCRAACASRTTRFSASTRRSGRAGRGLRLGFQRGPAAARVRVAVFRVSGDGRVLRGRQVARFRPRGGPFTWSGRLRGRPAPDGHYVVRFRSGGDTRRVPVLRRDGRFRTLPGYGSSRPCSALRALRLSSPLYGGDGNLRCWRDDPLRGHPAQWPGRRPGCAPRRGRVLGIAYRVSQPAQVGVAVTRNGRTLRRFAFRQRDPGTYRLRVRPRAPAVRVTVSLRGPVRTVRTHAVARRLR